MSEVTQGAAQAAGVRRGGLALGMLWRLAWRDVARNRRRSILSALGVAIGLALLIVANGLVGGVIVDLRENTIRLESGHLQLRSADYDDKALSLRPSELLGDLDARLARARALPGVRDATPVLWMRGLLTVPEDAENLRIAGIDPAAAFHAPIREGLTEGSYLAADDRDGILVGRRLAKNLGLSVGQKVGLGVVDGEGTLDQGTFTVRGIFGTGVPSYDEGTVFMALDKAQAFGRNRGRASAIVILLERAEEAPAAAAALAEPGVTALTWADLNELLTQYIPVVTRFYWILDAIVMLVVAVVIAGTLLMGVFERIREMGVLAALGMRGRQILTLFLLEAALLGLAGCALGLLLGLGGVAWMATVGLDFGEAATAGAGDIAIGTVMHARFQPLQMLALALWVMGVILVTSLYPARFAARMEPVDALRRV